MPRAVLVVALTLLVGGAGANAGAAASGDPLQAPECRQALAELQAEETAAASAPPARSERAARAIAPRLEASRRSVARLCLASRADPPAPGRLAQPPVVVAPVDGVRPPLPAASANVAIPPRAPTAPPLLSITSCDAAGCWASDGSRLHRVGPTLWGPRGACSVQGTVVHCP
jgi:hypothetical protein